jgi:hypothetical protein
MTSSRRFRRCSTEPGRASCYDTPPSLRRQSAACRDPFSHRPGNRPTAVGRHDAALQTVRSSAAVRPARSVAAQGALSIIGMIPRSMVPTHMDVETRAAGYMPIPGARSLAAGMTHGLDRTPAYRSIHLYDAVPSPVSLPPHPRRAVTAASAWTITGSSTLRPEADRKPRTRARELASGRDVSDHSPAAAPGHGLGRRLY